MEILKGYQKDKSLRDSFNALAESTFGLNFENWYRTGFWGEEYTPYSVVEDGKVLANVSLSRTDMIVRGQRKRLYQLGTVMTMPEYRNRGYIRAIMAKIEEDIRDADGVYLFANDSVLDFYPKFGFRPETEYVYSKALNQAGVCRMERVPMDGPENWGKLEKAMESSVFSDACHMVDNPGLIFFYVTQFMRDCVYYCRDLNTWAIAEIEDGGMVLHNVFGPETVSLEAVLEAFGGEAREVTLSFTPADGRGFDCRELHEEDTTFFVRGEGLPGFVGQRLRIPSLAHA